jgi:hypothetical protein
MLGVVWWRGEEKEAGHPLLQLRGWALELTWGLQCLNLIGEVRQRMRNLELQRTGETQLPSPLL